MKLKIIITALTLVVRSQALADTHYVDINNLIPGAPHTSWGSAATNLQDAINVAIDDDTVLVADGQYFLTSEIVVTNAITVQSVNGPEFTIVDGNGITSCFDLGSNMCVISSFTVTNANDILGGRGIVCDYFEEGSGGSIGRYVSSWNPVITNCIVTGNSGGGISGGTVINCTIAGNTAGGSGFPGFGGGLYSSKAINCIITNNDSTHDGGGMYYGEADNCLISGNTAGNDGGGAYYSWLTNCTVSDNLATNNGGGMSAGSAMSDGMALNSIVYYNTALNSGDDWSGTGLLFYSCSTSEWAELFGGCITNAPLFVDRSGGNYQLTSGSLCINSGDYHFTPPSPDLDGSPRIFDFVIDMGAYEFQGLLDSDADLMSDGYETYYFGGKTNAVAEENPDLDPHNNLQEYIAGTDPTNGMSRFSFTNATPDATGFIVQWIPCISNRLYSVNWTTNLSTGFQPLETGIEYPRNSCTDTVHTAENQGFYNVEVQLK